MPRLLPIVLALLVCAGPLFLFPDLVPASFRTATITLLAAIALASSLILLWPWRSLRPGLALFAFALFAGWALMSVRDIGATRHFAGAVFGVTAMAAMAAWCTSRTRLTYAALVIGLGALAIMSVGIVGAYFGWSGQKFVTGTTEATQTLLYPWLPHARLPLPGLERNDGWVNANALAGTALLLLPVSGGMLAAGRLAARHRGVLMALGGTATVMASAIIWMARSRTALLSAVLTGILLALAWHRGRRWVLAALVTGAIVIVALANQTRLAAPENFARGIEQVRTNASVRLTLWHDAADRLRERPIFGIGMSAFHESPRTRAAVGEGHVAHAHNIFIQIALDTGLVGLAGYLWFNGAILLMAVRLARASGVTGRLAAGAALSLVSVHFFGLGDAIALGAKVGLFQWLCAALVLGCAASARERAD